MKTKYINQLPIHHLEAGPWIRPIFRAQASPKSSDKILNSSRVQGEKSHFGDIGVLFRGYLSLAGYFQDQECNYSFEIIFVKRLKSQSTPRCWDKRSDDTVHVSPTGTQATVKLSQPMSGAERVMNSKFLRNILAPHIGALLANSMEK